MMTFLAYLFISVMIMIVVGFSGFILGKRVGDKDLVCPYCQLKVIGATTVDHLTHMICIESAKEDKPKVLAVPEDEYFIAINYVLRPANVNLAVCDLYNNEWATYDTRIYRNGKEIDQAYYKTHSGGEKAAKQKIELDKHKRKAIALNRN